MSVLIKGMEMPKSCWRCTLSHLYEKPRKMLVCKITHEEVLRHKIDSNCPLISVPPHGRLIDADALLKPKNQHVDVLADEWYVTVRTIETAPTILEAEEEE